MSLSKSRPRIVIVGGGAGGLELATRLGRKLGRDRAQITLIDAQLTHMWRPLFHEVAAGTLSSYGDALNYYYHAAKSSYRFRPGIAFAVDRSRKIVKLAPPQDLMGHSYLPPADVPYDYLVLAVGSETNDFDISGVTRHCHFLDSFRSANEFQQALLKAHYMGMMSSSRRKINLDIAIVGAGATGVELAAELRTALSELSRHGISPPNRPPIGITLIEGSSRILPALPASLAHQAEQALRAIGITIRVNAKVSSAHADGFTLDSGDEIAAGLKVWAAGIRAPNWLANIEGAVVSRVGQLIVNPSLRTVMDDHIWAIGDCAACPLDGGGWVPPRAQAAHQQARQLAVNLELVLNGKLPNNYRYKDFGSLVNISHFGTVGHLMGNLGKWSPSFKIEGFLARLAYRTLYREHLAATYGYWHALVLTLADWLTHSVRPRLKMH